MSEAKFSLILTILLALVVVAIIGLGGYMGISYYRDYKKSKEAGLSVNSFIEEAENEPNKKIETNEAGNIADYVNEIELDNTTESSTGKNKWTYKGFNVIGVIEIPKTKVKYFVLEDPPTVKSLEVSVVALYPKHAELNKIGNVVIVGHNYRNGLFFSNNKNLANGDKIYITDLNKNKVTYTIYNIFQANQNDVSFYNRDTNGKMEITLSSCTDAGDDQRIIIEARAE